MVDNRFGGLALKLRRIGSVDTRKELEKQVRSNKNVYPSAASPVSH